MRVTTEHHKRWTCPVTVSDCNFSVLECLPYTLKCNMLSCMLTVCAPGFYTSATNGNCLRCPNNSNSTQPGLSECSCNQGYYRTAQDVDLHCVCKFGNKIGIN